MATNERLLQAIRNQGETLANRAEWLQMMIDRQSRVIENAEKMIETCLIELKAVNLTLDATREEYRRMAADKT